MTTLQPSVAPAPPEAAPAAPAPRAWERPRYAPPPADQGRSAFPRLLLLTVAVGLAGGVVFGAGVTYGRSGTTAGAQVEQAAVELYQTVAGGKRPPGTDPVDLGPYGTPGFTWDPVYRQVTTINEGEFVAKATTRQEAQAAVSRWVGRR